MLPHTYFPEIPGEEHRNHPLSRIERSYNEHAATAAPARISTSSSSSAADRLQWRSHPALVSPGLDFQDRDPFEAVETGQRQGGNGNGTVGGDVSDEREEKEGELWSTTTFTISQMTPIWIFPCYPLLIIGPHAGNLAPKVSNPDIALTIILTGYVVQGIGFLVSLMIYAAFIYRLMTQKLPKESIRPGMFVSVGPSGFTISGIVTMGQELPKVVPPNFMGEGIGQLAGRVGMICANFIGLWLWGLALWFFFVSVGAHWSCAGRGKMDFAMTWYSFVFPNTALTTATFAIARALDGNKPIQYVGCAMTVALVMMWLFVVVMTVRAIMIRQILWPEKQEDRTEGGWKQQSADEQKRRQSEMGARGRNWSLTRTFSRRGTTGASVMRRSEAGRIVSTR
ncbi:Nn.00g088800.m01.CDS01 [Neocucurbitaria sp. VM-36]